MNRAFLLSCVSLLGLFCSSCTHRVQTVEGLPQHEVSATPAPAATTKAARHVILMIGDGMGPEHVWAAWACNGGKLNLMRLPVCGWSRTSSASHAITDSAAGGTAIACGERTSNGTVGQSAEGEPFTSVATELRKRGYATGLVATKSITDATPASFYAHAASRNQRALIGKQLEGAGFSVVLGGGSADVPKDAVERMRAGGALVELSARNDLKPATQRGNYLPQAVERALAHLGKGDQPFFLMVEGSQIDVASHWNDMQEMTAEVLEFDRALAVALDWAARHPDTLVLVTADHQTGGLSLLDADLKAGRVKGHFSTLKHSGLAVPVYAAGAGAQHFAGHYENRNILPRLRRACSGVQGGKKSAGR